MKNLFLTDLDLNLAEIEAEADSRRVAERGVIMNATAFAMKRRIKARGINLHMLSKNMIVCAWCVAKFLTKHVQGQFDQEDLFGGAQMTYTQK